MSAQPVPLSPESAWSFAAHRGFGTLVAVAGRQPTAAHVPFVVDATAEPRRVALIVARSSALHGALAAAPAALLVVTGPDAYVSPHWYESAGLGPAWTHVAVHIAGLAHFAPADHAGQLVARLTAQFEAKLAPKAPWVIGQLPPARQQEILDAIVPVEIEVTGVTAIRALAQDLPDADRIAVARLLAWQGNWATQAVAELMNADLRVSA